jgi:hypothetical protein
MKFYLGVPEPCWLERTETIPLFISRRRFARLKSLPRARGPYAIDSGGFTELKEHGGWAISHAEFVRVILWIIAEVGQPDFVAPQDWMCEEVMLAKTGLTVAEHQRRTVESYVRLRDDAPAVPWIPVIQGWTLGQYLDCIELYEKWGVDLKAAPLVGVGSVCRRQSTLRAVFNLSWFADMGLKLHGFGLKTEAFNGLANINNLAALASADSMAWSDSARHGWQVKGYTVSCGKRRCNNCWHYAAGWHQYITETKLRESYERD